MAGSYRPVFHRHHHWNPFVRVSKGFRRFSYRVFRPVNVMSFTLSPVASMILVFVIIGAIAGTMIYLGVTGKFTSSSSSPPPPYKPTQQPPSPYPQPPAPYPQPPSPYPPTQ
jgi:hypothetical protein